jgi:hypothetical protein
MEDMVFARRVYDELFDDTSDAYDCFLMNDIVGLLRSKPELMEINKDVVQKEML